MFKNYFNTLGHRFIVGGDWNAKHTFWGSRCTSTRGRDLKRCADENHLKPISTGEATYWPSDPKKLPDLLDFFINKGIDSLHTTIESSLDGSSDHTPAILTISTSELTREITESLTNCRTDWDGFKTHLNESFNSTMPLKNQEDVDNACRYVTNAIQVAAWINTPSRSRRFNNPSHPPDIRHKILEKRRLRRIWQQSRHPLDKLNYNKAAKELKTIVQESINSTLKTNLQMMSPTGIGVNSLWKATKNLHKPQQSYPPIRSQSTWARTDLEKAEVFALHLNAVFKPNESTVDERELDTVLEQDLQMCLPITPTSPKEIAREIRLLNSKKAPGFDLITPTILKNLPRKCITFLASLFNAIFRTSHFPDLWKVSQVAMIHKLGKPEHEASSYRPISLTPVLSKLWEKIFLHRLNPVWTLMTLSQHTSLVFGNLTQQ